MGEDNVSPHQGPCLHVESSPLALRSQDPVESPSHTWPPHWPPTSCLIECLSLGDLATVFMSFATLAKDNRIDDLPFFLLLEGVLH